MPGDHTRFTYDPLRDYGRVRAQQGRALLDADLTELVDGFDHRMRALALDVLGPCTAPVDLAAGPAAAATGFRIQAGGASFTIGLGRLYLHGLRLDNHGTPPYEVEPGLRDRRGAAPVPYEDQPYHPDPPPVPRGRHVVYVDAWDREVTAVEDPALVDPAVGVDTSTRMQTVWQVKVLPDDAGDVTCETPDEDVPGWAAATRRSGARLSTDEVGTPAVTDPCSVPPDGGYRGWDNRLYRVEVHDGGALSAATFKWSRDNASVGTAVLAIDSTRTVLTVARTGHDDVQRIRENAWVEVLDDPRELTATAGFLAKVVTVDPVDAMTQTVRLSAAVPADVDPADPDRRTRLRQWDHTTASSTVPCSDAAGGLVLEDGVEVTFAADPSGGDFRTGEFWTFAARSADGSVERLDAAPAHGPVHFHGRLAVIDLPAVVDCRTIWPPEAGEGCGDCTECVTPQSHASGALTIQMAVDRVRETGGTVCLGPGRYPIEEPVRIEGARGLTVRGQGVATVVEYAGEGSPAFLVFGSYDVRLLDLTVLLAPEDTGDRDPRREDRDVYRKETSSARELRTDTNLERRASRRAKAERAAREAVVIGIGIGQSGGVRVERCVVADTTLVRPAVATVVMLSSGSARSTPGAFPAYDDDGRRSVAVALVGSVVGLVVRDCVLVADVGVAPWHLVGPISPGGGTTKVTTAMRKWYLLLAGCEISACVVVGTLAGVWLDEATFAALAGVRRSLVAAIRGVGVHWAAVPFGGVVEVADSLLAGRVAAVEWMSSGARFTACRLVGSGRDDEDRERPADRDAAPDGDALVVADPPAEGALADVVVRGCTLTATRRGVWLTGDVEDVVVADNVVSAVAGGVVTGSGTTGRRVVVSGNEVRVTGRGAGGDQDDDMLTGIWLTQVTSAEVSGNRVYDLGSEAGDVTRMGIAIEHCPSAVVRDNVVTDYVGHGRALWVVGIGAWPFASRLDVHDNIVTVDSRAPAPPASDMVSVSGIRIDVVMQDRTFASAWSAAATNRMTAERRAPAGAPREEATMPAGVPSYLVRSSNEHVFLGDRPVRLAGARAFSYQVGTVPAVTVAGNRVDVNGFRPAVIAVATGPLLVTGNTVRHAGVVEALQVRPDWAVIGAGDSAVVGNNHVDTPSGAMRLMVNVERIAVTGNVTSGEINVAGAPLAAPWVSINVRLA